MIRLIAATFLGLVVTSLSGLSISAATLEVWPEQIGQVSVEGVVELRFVARSDGDSFQPWAEYRLSIGFDSTVIRPLTIEFDTVPGGERWIGQAGFEAPDYSGPPNMVLYVRVAEPEVDGDHPTVAPGTDWTLFTVGFQVTDASVRLEEETPVEFFWSDCLDNTFLVASEDTVLAAETVYDAYGFDITDPTQGLPSRFGPHDSCATLLLVDHPTALASVVLRGALVELGGTPTDVEDDAGLKDRPGQVELTVSPNPIVSNTSFTVSTSGMGELRLELFDILGRRRGAYANMVGPGIHRIGLSSVVDTGRLPSGVYFCRVTFGQSSVCRRMVRLK